MRKWETGDGRSIPLCEMTEQHIRNVLEMLKARLARYQDQDNGSDWYLEKIDETEDWIIAFTDELSRREKAISKTPKRRST